MKTDIKKHGAFHTVQGRFKHKNSIKLHLKQFKVTGNEIRLRKLWELKMFSYKS